MDNNIIYWIRHAESCSNFRSDGVTDKIPGDYINYGYNKIEISNKYDSNNNLNTENSMVKYDKTFENYADYSFEPTLSFIGIQQAIKLGIDYLDVDFF